MIKKAEIKNMDVKRLEENLIELRKELIRINAQISTGTTPENPGNVKQLKKNIARILTYIKQEETNVEEHKEDEKIKIKKEDTKSKEEKQKDNE